MSFEFSFSPGNPECLGHAADRQERFTVSRQKLGKENHL